MDHRDDRAGRTFRYNDTTETASREAADRARRGEERVVPNAGESGAGAAAGTFGGALAGGTAGFLVLGPVGAAIAAVAGALGGWWSEEAATSAASSFTPEEDHRYHTHYESLPNRPADRGYEEIRPAYQLGHVAGHNPAYRGKRFEEIEPDLTRVWSDEMREHYGDWAGMRGYVRDAYARKSAAPAESEQPDRPSASAPPHGTNDTERHHG